MATRELDGLKASLTNKFTEFAAQLRQNNIDHVNSLVPIHKEVQKIANARDALVEGIAECYDRVGKVEDTLFKAQVFELQTNHQELADVHIGILRREHESLPNYSPIVAVSGTYTTNRDRQRHMFFNK